MSENGYSKLDSARNRKDYEANPFLIGEEGIKNYFADLRKQIDCAIEKQKQD